MKQLYAFTILGLLLMPACLQKDEEKVSSKKAAVKKSYDAEGAAIPLADASDVKSGFFDENVNAFVFEDDLDSAESGIAVTRQDEDQALSWMAQSESPSQEFKQVYFDFGHNSIRQDQVNIVDDNAKKAKKLADSGERVVIEGHACHSAGSKTYNLLLSEQRAQKVASRLESAGVKVDNMKVVGRGTEMPIVVGGDKDIQSPNRRVEIFSIAT